MAWVVKNLRMAVMASTKKMKDVFSCNPLPIAIKNIAIEPK